MLARVRSLISDARRSPFASNIGRLAASTIVGQAVTLASAPLLSRLYTPSEFGLFGLFLAYGMFASVITTLFYEGAIPVASEDDALALVAGTMLVSFGVGCVVALGFARRLTRDTVGQSAKEARRLVDALSWAVVLPQMLGMLGLVFAASGVGIAVAHLLTSYIDLSFRPTAIAVYCVGMALFTVIMGNGFAAFPVMAGGVGVPILIGAFHGNPAPVVAIGMFSGYCGTLLTPMAANYNIVPAALLELPDKYGVIRAQAPTGLALLVVNIILLNILM